MDAIDFDYLISEEALKCRRETYFKKYDLEGVGACWGYGNCFKKLFTKISGICPVVYICDTDEKKWGEEYGGCKVIFPGELVKHHVSFVVITVLDSFRVSEIRKQLEAYGITAYCHINEWLKLII